MKRLRFTDSQILAVLRQAEAGTAVPDLCREHGISSATFYKWRSKYVMTHRFLHRSGC
jgi:putative transposase